MRKALLILGLTLLVLPPLPAPAAQAQPSTASSRTLDADWAKATFTAVRDGWHVRVTITLRDKPGSFGCPYARATLNVTAGLDPSTSKFEVCDNKTKTKSFTLRPGLGTKFSELKIRVCDPDVFGDDCKTGTLPVRQNRAERADLSARMNGLMTESLSAFMKHKKAKGGPWNWSDNGCNSPAVRAAEFYRACARHDFGYRNYGWGLTVNPTDSRRLWVDERFRTDMRAICRANHSGKARTDCYKAAAINYAGVRAGGGAPFFNQ